MENPFPSIYSTTSSHNKGKMPLTGMEPQQQWRPKDKIIMDPGLCSTPHILYYTIVYL